MSLSSLPVISTKQSAILVGIQLPNKLRKEVENDLEELAALLKTLGVEVIDRIIQRRAKPTAKCLLGTGKVEEIRIAAGEVCADMVVFDQPLSGPQIRNLEKMTGCQISDRHGIILEIFAQHAKTPQARTQVEIAQLEYLLPRLTGQWTHFGRQTGGRVRSRGMGEKQIEVDRRQLKSRMAKLRMQLKQISKERKSQRKARQSELQVAMVGYTNTGKTTVMQSLTQTTQMAQDALFATLDSNVKTIDPTTRPRILLADTVGFIRNLPHSLIASFRSTLEEVLHADLLLHVVDISHPNYREQMETTEAVLAEIGASHIPMLIVFNKVDQVDKDEVFLPRIMKSGHPGSICISALEPSDANRLRTHIFEFFCQNFKTATIYVPHSEQHIVSQIHQNCLILDSDYSDSSEICFEVQASSTTLSQIRAQIEKKS